MWTPFTSKKRGDAKTELCSPWGNLEGNNWHMERNHVILHLYLRSLFLSIKFVISIPSLCFGEGNGKPLQYTCLENPMDGGAWKAAVHGVTECLHFHFSLACIGEGNGNLLQCSCLENPRDGGDWSAAVCGVTQSRTRLKWLSSSSSRISCLLYAKFYL